MDHARSRKLFLYISLVALLFSPMGAYVQAAEPYGNRSPDDAQNAISGSVGSYSPPAIYVTKTELGSSGSPLSGTFNILNNADDTVGDLRYRFELLEKLPVAQENQLVEDSGRMYNSVLSSDILALIPGEERSIPFTYTPPKVPAGEYRFRVQLTTSQGRDLGWNDTAVNLSGSADQFVDLLPGTISLPEFPDQVIHPQSGPNVSPSSAFTLKATAKNPHTKAVTVTPSLAVYDFATSGKTLSTTPQAPITLEPNKDVLLDIPVIAPTTPGVYYGELTLNVGETRVSPIAQYRFVVRGTSAHIISARIKELHTKMSESVNVAVEYAGPADAETALKATLHIDVLDSTGIAGSFQAPETLELTDAIGGGLAHVPLTRDLVGAPGLKVVLKGEDGTVLDTYDVAMPLTPEQLKNLETNQATAANTTNNDTPDKSMNKRVAMYILVGVLLLALLALVLYMHKKKNSNAIPLGLFFVIATAFTVTHGVLAAGTGAGIEVVNPLRFGEPASGYKGGTWEIAFGGDTPVVEVFINQPHHNRPVGTYNKNAVPFQYRMQYGVCSNYMAKSRIILRFDKNGGKHSNLVGSSSSNWSQLISTQLAGAFNQCTSSTVLPGYCLINTGNGGSATLNLSALNDDALNTTLQVGGFWNHIAELSGVAQTLDPNNWHITARHAHVTNLWLNFRDEPVTPTPTPSPTPSPNANRAPVAVAKMSVDNGATYSSDITVTQNKTINVRLAAGARGGTGSSDPDGWATPGKGVAVGGKCEWNSDLNIGPATYETTKTDPVFPATCDMDLGPKKFTLNPGHYTYNLLKITDAAGAESNTGSITFHVIEDPNPNENKAPYADAKMSVDGGATYSSEVTVIQNEPVNVRLSAGWKGSGGSYDPDGWDTPGKGVSVGGGKIQWNTDLNRGTATYEKTYLEPSSPSAADHNLGTKKFTTVGTYTYNLLKITDAAGVASNTGQVTIIIKEAPTVTPQPPTPTPTPGDFEETR